jgi:hypothetical protein
MTAAAAGANLRRSLRLISMHRVARDALIRCKERAVIRLQCANSLIALDSSRMAQPVLISDPDSQVHRPQPPTMGRGTSCDEAHYSDHQAIQA